MRCSGECSSHTAPKHPAAPPRSGGGLSLCQACTRVDPKTPPLRSSARRATRQHQLHHPTEGAREPRRSLTASPTEGAGCHPATLAPAGHLEPKGRAASSKARAAVYVARGGGFAPVEPSLRQCKYRSLAPSSPLHHLRAAGTEQCACSQCGARTSRHCSSCFQALALA
ncbi:hypothetical protein NDU88_006566 [Pleurodeles waltl]|uniref:Uncharacterized protein n=1 Tax=Pleurodeles waltl TaxID=8319 RepID=A0AAV7PIR1_PLEWA|nr:hypothetical protein NDU88_006566 [Pleurodeles waltl]